MRSSSERITPNGSVSHVTGDVERCLADDGAITIPCADALRREFDLAISVHHSGELHRIQAPLAVCRTESCYGLAWGWLVHEDGSVPDAVVLAHEYDRVRLARLAPEALTNAVVAGDPCYDRLFASRELRERYRAVLGAPPGTTVVTLSSTWGAGSPLGRHPDLVDDLISQLDMDEHVVAAIAHPNAWFAHGPPQMRAWFTDALRAGLRLIPPERGWQQTILASDLVTGDHGSVTGYAAAHGIPTMLASFPREEVAGGHGHRPARPHRPHAGHGNRTTRIDFAGHHDLRSGRARPSRTTHHLAPGYRSRRPAHRLLPADDSASESASVPADLGERRISAPPRSSEVDSGAPVSMTRGIAPRP